MIQRRYQMKAKKHYRIKNTLEDAICGHKTSKENTTRKWNEVECKHCLNWKRRVAEGQK